MIVRTIHKSYLIMLVWFSFCPLKSRNRLEHHQVYFSRSMRFKKKKKPRHVNRIPLLWKKGILRPHSRVSRFKIVLERALGNWTQKKFLSERFSKWRVHPDVGWQGRKYWQFSTLAVFFSYMFPKMVLFVYKPKNTIWKTGTVYNVLGICCSV